MEVWTSEKVVEFVQKKHQDWYDYMYIAQLLMHNICIGVPSGVMMSSSVPGMSLMKCTALKEDYQVTYNVEM